MAKKNQETDTYFSTNAILPLCHTHRRNFEMQNALVPSMPSEDNNFGGSLVLDLRILLTFALRIHYCA